LYIAALFGGRVIEVIDVSREDALGGGGKDGCRNLVASFGPGVE
jgi:hypothetical protein